MKTKINELREKVENAVKKDGRALYDELSYDNLFLTILNTIEKMEKDIDSLKISASVSDRNSNLMQQKVYNIARKVEEDDVR